MNRQVGDIKQIYVRELGYMSVADYIGSNPDLFTVIARMPGSAIYVGYKGEEIAAEWREADVIACMYFRKEDLEEPK